ncbi:MAG: PDZ domain-containing protein, partial [candidate division Zixibacteria bacterium]|nr:PDZ domain-containing protein [candidate division Zixibacteria bacterium]
TPQTISVALDDRSKYQPASATEDSEPVRESPKWLGLEVATATQDMAEEYGTEFHPGVVVTEADRSGPAYDKGIRVGMIISEIDHTEIKNRADFLDVVRKLGDVTRPVSLLVYDRRGNTGYIAVRPERKK